MIRGARRDDGHGSRHARTAHHQGLPSAQFLDVPQTAQRRDHHDGRLQSVQQQLSMHAGDAGSLGHQREVVAGGREVELAEPGDAGHQECAVARGTGVEKLAEVPEPFVGPVQVDHGKHFVKFDLHHERIRVAVTVVFCQDGLCRVEAVVC